MIDESKVDQSQPVEEPSLSSIQRKKRRPGTLLLYVGFALAGGVAFYYLGRDCGWGWDGFFCIAFGGLLGQCAGILLADGDERWALLAFLLGMAIAGTIWWNVSEVAAGVLATICRMALGVLAGIFLVGAGRYDGKGTSDPGLGGSRAKQAPSLRS